LKINSEVKVGITVLLAAVAAVIGFRFMSDIPVFKQAQEYTSTFERVDGLGTGSQVIIRGVKVGSVNRVQLVESDSVMITMRLDLDERLPKNSVARLTSLGLIEGKSIVIERGDSDEYIEEGGRVKGIYVDSMMEVLGERGEEIGEDLSDSFTELNQFLRQLNKTLDDESSASLDRTIHNVESVTRNISDVLDSKKEEINEAIASGSSMMGQLDTMATTNRPKVDSLMASLEYNVRELEKVRVEIESALET